MPTVLLIDMIKKRIDYWKDGDSGKFTDGNHFRLARVRAPEKYQFGGESATRRAAGMSGRTKGLVNVRTLGRDSYGRFIVEIYNKDGSINNRLLRRGSRNKGR